MPTNPEQYESLSPIEELKQVLKSITGNEAIIGSVSSLLGGLENGTYTLQDLQTVKEAFFVCLNTAGLKDDKSTIENEYRQITAFFDGIEYAIKKAKIVVG